MILDKIVADVSIELEKRKNEIEDLKRNLRENYIIQTDLSKLNQQ